jgi:hypothetical protein
MQVPYITKGDNSDLGDDYYRTQIITSPTMVLVIIMNTTMAVVIPMVVVINDDCHKIYYNKKIMMTTIQQMGYCDSGNAMCPDTRLSNTRWLLLLGKGTVFSCSQRRKGNPLSSMDSEYIAGAEGAREAIWLRWFINDLLYIPDF